MTHFPQNVKLHERTKGTTLPQGAVLLRNKDILDIQHKIIRNWNPAREMWPFWMSAPLVTSFASFSGIYFRNHFRKTLKLRNHGRISTLVASLVLPVATIGITHQLHVTNPILLKLYDCPMCMELRSGSIMTVLGVAQPFSLALLMTIMIARAKYTVKTPDIYNFKEWTSFINKNTKHLRGKFLGLFCFSFIFGSALAKAQQDAAIKVWQEMAKINSSEESEEL